MWQYNYSDELMHFGVPGMKWGRRKGPQRVLNARDKMKTAKKQLKSDNKEYSRAYNKAYDRSLAVVSPLKKQRQANTKRWEDTYDKAKQVNKSKAVYKKAKKEYKQVKTSSKQQAKKTKMSNDAKEIAVLKKKKVNELSNADLRKANDRLNLEQNYSRLNRNKVQTGIAAVAATAATMNTILKLYNNSDKLIKTGRNVVKKFMK